MLRLHADEEQKMRLDEHFEVVAIDGGKWRRIDPSGHRPGRTDMTRVHLVPVTEQARRFVEERITDLRYCKSGEGRHQIGARMVGVGGEYLDEQLGRWMPAIRMVESSLEKFYSENHTSTYERELEEYFR